MAWGAKRARVRSSSRRTREQAADARGALRDPLVDRSRRRRSASEIGLARSRARRPAPASDCTMIMLTRWATMPWSSRAMRCRSAATTRRLGLLARRSSSSSRFRSSIAVAYRPRVRARSPSAQASHTTRIVWNRPWRPSGRPPRLTITAANRQATTSVAMSDVRRSRRSATVYRATIDPRPSLTLDEASRTWRSVAPNVIARTAMGKRRRATSGSDCRRSSATLSGWRAPRSVAPPPRASSERAVRPRAMTQSTSRGSTVRRRVGARRASTPLA